ncbi:MAG: hypothetical protein R3F21_22170 [Myxococcota bacterium]
MLLVLKGFENEILEPAAGHARADTQQNGDGTARNAATEQEAESCSGADGQRRIRPDDLAQGGVGPCREISGSARDPVEIGSQGAPLLRRAPPHRRLRTIRATTNPAKAAPSTAAQGLRCTNSTNRESSC